MKNKKTALLIPSLSAGGAERQCVLLANSLAQSGYDVSIYVLWHDKSTIYEISPQVRVYDVPPLKFGRAVSTYLVYMEWLFLKNVPDVVISFLWAANYLASEIAFRLHIPVILLERSNPRMAPPLNFYYRGIKKRIPYVSRFLTQTEKCSRHLAQYMGLREEQTGYIPNQVTPVTEVFPAPVSGKYLLGVGRLVQVKGYERMLRCFAAVRQVLPEYRLVICGDGKEKAALEKIAEEYHISESVVWCGVQKKLEPYYQNAEALLVTSRFEGFPNVILEAFANRCPVISFDLDYGPRDIITDHVDGLLVPQDDEKAFTNAVVEYLKDPEMKKKFIANIPAKTEQFSPERITGEWIDLIEKVTAFTA